MKKYKCGIFGASRIAASIVKVLDNIPNRIEKYGVASLHYENSIKFAKKYDFKKVYNNYIELLEDDNIDFVYISTPVGVHYDNIKQSLLHNKHVLCEKSLVFNSNEAEELFFLAKERGLLLMDGIWSMYMPGINLLAKMIDEGRIGKLKRIRSSHGFPEKINDMRFTLVGGGAIYDKGIYGIALSQKILNDNKINTVKKVKKKTVGKDNICTECKLIFKHGDVVCIDKSSIIRKTSYLLFVLGTKGVIFSRYFWNGRNFYVYNFPFKIRKYEYTHDVNGYEWQIYEFIKLLDNNKLESSYWNQSQTIKCLKIIEEANKIRD